MPLCTLSLVTLRDGEAEDVAKRFVASIIHAGRRPILAGHYKRRIIAPERIDVDVLRGHVMVILEGSDGLPDACRGPIVALYELHIGVPSALLNKFDSTNRQLFATPAPPLTGSLNKPRLAQSTQLLEANDCASQTKTPPLTSDALIQWARNGPRSPITMLNLLAFREGMHETYLKYGKAFGESIGARRGGNAKIVGRVVAPPAGKRDSRTTAGKHWDEIACAHYPSPIHFADMAASDDYQDVNHQYRVPSLYDTTIMCFRDFDLDELATPKSKL